MVVDVIHKQLRSRAWIVLGAVVKAKYKLSSIVEQLKKITVYTLEPFFTTDKMHLQLNGGPGGGGGGGRLCQWRSGRRTKQRTN